MMNALLRNRQGRTLWSGLHHVNEILCYCIEKYVQDIYKNKDLRKNEAQDKSILFLVVSLVLSIWNVESPQESTESGEE